MTEGVTEQALHRKPARIVVTLFWGGITSGLTIPWLSALAVDFLKHGLSISQALRQFQLHLFAPGYNLFLVGALNAIPFILFAVFALFHLGLVSPENRKLIRRRGAGVMVTSLGMIGISTWVHVTTLWYPDAQDALAYLVLPFVLTGSIPAGYALGRGLGVLMFR